MVLPAFLENSHEDHHIRPDCPVGSRWRRSSGQRTRRQVVLGAAGPPVPLTSCISVTRTQRPSPDCGGRLAWQKLAVACNDIRKVVRIAVPLEFRTTGNIAARIVI